MSLAASIPVPSFPAVDWQTAEKGVPLSMLEEFAAYSGFAVSDLFEVVIAARTLKHRRSRNESFNLDESDRLARVARLFQLAVRVFGSAEVAHRWLLLPKIRFDQRSPLSMMRTELGGQLVQEFLFQIDEGMVV